MPDRTVPYIEDVETSVQPSPPFSGFLSWLSLEAALWLLVGLLALWLRGWRIDAAPLRLPEAENSLLAWRFVHDGQSPAADAAYSPALFSGQAAFFLLFGAGDAIARLWPALAGLGLTLAPLLMRRQLGRGAALATGGLLALSPTAVLLSRTATGDVLTALGSLLLVAGLWRMADETKEPLSSLILAVPALGLGLILSSSPLAYSALIALVGALALLLGTAQSADPDAYPRFRQVWARLGQPAHLKLGLALFAGGLTLLSTAFVWNVGGLGAMADLFVRWLDGFVIWSDDLGWGYPFTLLLAYDFMILLLGGIGVLIALLRLRPSGLYLIFWAGVSLLLALVRSGHGPGDVLLALVPLACLGGVALEGLAHALRREGRWRDEGLILLISLPLWAVLWANLTRYVAAPYQLVETSALFQVDFPTRLGRVILMAFLLLLVLGVFGLLQGSASALRGAGLSLVIVLTLSTWAAAWGASHARPADPRELLLVEPTSPQVRLMRASLERLSNDHYQAAHAIDLTVQAPADEAALLAWYLRDFPTLFVDRLGPEVSSPAVVGPQPPPTPNLGPDYIGQTFVLRRSWRPLELGCKTTPVSTLRGEQVGILDCSGLFRWLLYRQSPPQPEEQAVVLWVREDLWSVEAR